MPISVAVERLKEVGGEYRWVPEYEVFDAEKECSIDPDQLDKELCTLPQFLMRAGDITAELEAEVSRKKSHLDSLSADLAARFKRSGEKPTVRTLDDYVQGHPEYTASVHDYNESFGYERRAKNYWTALKYKAELLKAASFRASTEMRHQ